MGENEFLFPKGVRAQVEREVNFAKGNKFSPSLTATRTVSDLTYSMASVLEDVGRIPIQGPLLMRFLRVCQGVKNWILSRTEADPA